jgi:hypothetical protein
MSDRDNRLKPEEWQKLKAEWMYDYELRRMGNRGVKYEDEAERKLDHAAARGTGGGQDGPPASSIAQGQATTVTPPGRKQPGQDHRHNNGHEHDNGHSM